MFLPYRGHLQADILNILVSILFLNINQLDALNFITSVFQACTCFEHMWSSSGGQNCVIQPLASSHTRDCIIQFCPPDDEHLCSKHVQAWNKLVIKFSASSWLILRNKYIEMHGQQNIKKKKVLVSVHNTCRRQIFPTLPSLQFTHKCMTLRGTTCELHKSHHF